jgi:hypothetical protein
MPLNLEPRPSDFIPYVKFKANAGRWYSKNVAGEQFEVANMTASFDLESIRVGWVHFSEGQAPDTAWDSGSVAAAPPTPLHKRGFSLNVYSKKELGGVREFSSTSNVTIIAIKELYEKFENAAERKRGMVPVVRCDNVLPMKSKFGTNYQPVLTLARWVARPAELPAHLATASGSGNGTDKPATQQSATRADVPPPLNKLAQQTATDDEEF